MLFHFHVALSSGNNKKSNSRFSLRYTNAVLDKASKHKNISLDWGSQICGSRIFPSSIVKFWRDWCSGICFVKFWGFPEFGFPRFCVSRILNFLNFLVTHAKFPRFWASQILDLGFPGFLVCHNLSLPGVGFSLNFGFLTAS